MSDDGRCPRDASCPNRRAHDTYSAYRWGCTSPRARAAKRRYDKLQRAGLARGGQLPALPYARRLQALAARGWRAEDIAVRVGRNKAFVARLRRGNERWVNRVTARWIDEVFSELWDVEGPSPLSRSRAELHGWVPAAAWDNIDDVTEKPKIGRRATHPPTERNEREEIAARRARCVRLAAQGESHTRIALQVGITPRSVLRHLAAARADAAQAQAEAS